ncbi:hypothetical protein B0H13DRAFT_1990450 [Mycena leptocephala]|nr:hypothetical protein B0H13DRAFT_1990450 [Mycena leptocephala]
MSKSKSKQEEALAFLDDLDSFTPSDAPAPTDTTAPAQGNGGGGEGEAEVLAFIDEITQKSAEPTPRSSHLTTERVRLGGGTTSLLRTPSSSSLRKDVGTAQPAAAPETGSGGGWGWGNVWNTASAAIQQAKSAVDEQLDKLGSCGTLFGVVQVLRKLGQDFKRVGLSTLTDILNVVAPPISEHEVIQVWLSHDMTGYEGIESLVYRALARIMEQVEGGDLIVNRGNESRPKESVDTPRDLGAVEGFEAASKLAQCPNPTTYSHIYLRIQPFLSSFAFPASSSAALPDTAPAATQQLQFLIYLADPSHKLTQSTITQCVPYEWVEDLMAEALRVGVEVIGQEYVVKRMGVSCSGKKTDAVGEPGELVEKPKLEEET